MKILVVDCNIEQNKCICKALSKCKGLLHIDSSFDAEDGLGIAMNGEYDIIVVGYNLIKITQENFVKKLKNKKYCGIISIINNSNQEKLLAMTKIGVDDFVVKPYHEDELVARVVGLYMKKTQTINKNLYEFKSMTVDYDTTTIIVNGDTVVMPGKIYEIFEYLIRNKNMIVTKDRLFSRVWGIDSDTIYTVTEVYVSKLRKILEKYNLKKHLVTIKNIGYMWDETV